MTLAELHAELAKADPLAKDPWQLTRARILAMEIWRNCSLERAMAFSFQRDAAADVATSAMNVCGKEREAFEFWTYTSAAKHGSKDPQKTAEDFIEQTRAWLHEHLMTLVMAVRVEKPELKKP